MHQEKSIFVKHTQMHKDNEVVGRVVAVESGPSDWITDSSLANLDQSDSQNSFQN